MLIIKRLAVWLLETLCEGILLSVLVLIMAASRYGPSQHHFAHDLLLAFAMIVAVFMIGTGYLATSAGAAVYWRTQRLWIYSTVASVLFLVHLEIPLISSVLASLL